MRGLAIVRPAAGYILLRKVANIRFTIEETQGGIVDKRTVGLRHAIGLDRNVAMIEQVPSTIIMTDRLQMGPGIADKVDGGAVGGQFFGRFPGEDQSDRVQQH